MTNRRLHHLSGIVISVFIALHLFNHLCSLFGAMFHIEVMNTLRLFYRNSVIEVLLFAAISIQIISGMILFRRERKSATIFFERLQIWTGLYLSLFLLLHVSAVLTGRYALHLDTNYYFGVAGLNVFPYNLFFIPYYGLAVISFFGHVASIHHRKMRHHLFGLTPSVQSKTIFISGFVFTLILFYGLTNHFKGVKIPAEYNVLVGK